VCVDFDVFFAGGAELIEEAVYFRLEVVLAFALLFCACVRGCYVRGRTRACWAA